MVECVACPEPCESADLYAAAYGTPFEIDMGSIKAPKQVHRQVIIATGKSDWIHDVFQSGLASQLTNHELVKAFHAGESDAMFDDRSHQTQAQSESLSQKHELSFYNCSMSEQGTKKQHTVLFLPDYRFVNANLDEIANLTVFPSAIQDQLGCQAIPYKALVLICSHTTRDSRCGRAAPVLLSAFERVCADLDLNVDHTGSSLLHMDDEASTIGVFFVSHVGGHKYAANVIVQFPRREQIWYARVLPQHVQQIVEKTVLGGEILSNLLRGTVDLQW